LILTAQAQVDDVGRNVVIEGVLDEVPVPTV